MQNIFIGADHRGFELKNHLRNFLAENGYSAFDCGNTELDQNDDYPDYAHKVAEAVRKTPESLGIVICGTGIGVSIAANKHKGIRSAVAKSKEDVETARSHNMINVLAMSADDTNYKKAEEIVHAFLKSNTSEEKRHLRRVQKIDLA